MAALEQQRLLAGRYRLQAVIGRGGMGAVWRARDELLNRDVAVKEVVWPPQMDAAEREAARWRVVREAQMAARIDHPNVVRVYDIFEDDDRPRIVMELVSYPSLSDVLEEHGPLSAAEAARVGLGVLAALRAAHDAGVVHRDVKPANILLGPRDRIVLADFGIARSIDSPGLTTTGVLVGSPPYIAPERARGGSAGPAADLWGLGASLYAAVEGRPPFLRDSALASVAAVVADEPDPPVHAGPLGPVISGLLRKDPGARLGVDAAQQMLRRIAEEERLIPGMGYPDSGQQTARLPHAPTPPAVARRGPARANSRFVGLAAALAIIVIAAAAAFLAARPHPRPTAHTGPKAGPTAPAPTSAAPPTSAPPASSAPAPARSASSAPVTSPGSSPPVGSGPARAPAGYRRFSDPTGFSIAVPAGWQISHAGHYVYIRDPADGGTFLLIDQSDQPKPDPLADWQQQAAARQSSYPGYHLIMLRAITYPQAQKAADWEFTYDKDGVEVQVLNRNILANAHHAYALYWSTPASAWEANYHFFRVFAATFQPAGP